MIINVPFLGKLPDILIIAPKESKIKRQKNLESE
tara:strand:+ start:223 stop:324 length:102 start_codon:yes stop_codon:yes gene_type:complete